MSDLKIANLEVFLLSYRYTEDEEWRWSGGITLQRNAVLVKVETNKGIHGIGEIGESAYLPRSVKQIVEERFRPLLVGEDPVNVEKLWQKMYIRSAHWGRKGVVVPIISGIEIALWDILGKWLNKSVYELLGGAYRERIRVYASAGMSKPFHELVEEVRQYVEEGHRAVKIRIGHEDPRSDIELVRELRDVVGNEVDLMVDAGQCYVDFPWDFNTALKVARELEKCNVFWLEEPLHPDDIEGYKRLCEAVDVPIAAGENEFTRFGFKELIVNRAVDILQPDVARSGGISECKKIAAMASAFHLRCAPHIFGSGVGFMANMHFIASTPNAFVMEYDRTPNPLREELLMELPHFSGGYIHLIKGIPGLGVRLTEEILEKFAFRENEAVLKQDFIPLW